MKDMAQNANKSLIKSLDRITA